MATSQFSTTGITSIEQLQFIRARSVSWSVSNLRPNTRYFAFFDGKEVTSLTTQRAYTGLSGTVFLPTPGEIYTDNSGKASGLFNIPAMTFGVGSKEFMLSDTLDYTTSPVGSMISSATASYTTAGIKAISQTTTTDVSLSVKQTLVPEVVNNAVNITVPPPVVNAVTNVTNLLTNLTRLAAPVPRLSTPQPTSKTRPVIIPAVPKRKDPIAQSFFTHGIAGGFFLTKLELFFESVDADSVVHVSIRDMVAGVPADSLVDEWASVSLSGKWINESSDSTVPTAFVFERPVYLQEDKDYCFVVQSSSSGFNLWTSRMGEKMVDRNAMISDQPYNGSLFKSENNFTWTAEQYEDIKFKMFQAVFDTNPGVVGFKVTAPETVILGSNLTTTSGSTTVTVELPYEHCLTVGDRVTLNPLDNCTFNGITTALIKETFPGLGYVNVTSIVDKFKFTFQAGVTANATGQIDNCNRLITIQVTNAGTNYAPGDLALTITANPGDTIVTPATAYARVSRVGTIVDVIVTNSGIGYKLPPTITVTTPGVGTGALFESILDPEFWINTNRAMDMIESEMDVFVPPGAMAGSTIKTVSGKSPEGNEAPYIESADTDITSTEVKTFRDRQWLLSPTNTTLRNVHNVIKYNLETDNENVSPVIDGYGVAHTRVTGNVINSQSAELNAAPVVATAIVAGNGYKIVTLGTTNFTLIGAKTNTVGATFIATAAGTGTGTAHLNSELKSIGTAESRYFSRRVSLNFPANGFKVFVTAKSETNSGVDVYVKTGSSSVDSTSVNSIDHATNAWTQLVCAVDRNLSSTETDFFEYEFDNEYDLPEFDVYELKIVIRSSNPARSPILNDYRCIALTS